MTKRRPANFSNPDQLDFSFSAKYFWLFVGIGSTATIAGLVAYILVNGEPTIKTSQLIAVITPIVAGGTVMTTLLYNTFNYHLNHQLNSLKLKQDQKIAALNLIGEFQKKEMIDCTFFTIGYFKQNGDKNIKELSPAILKDKDLRLAATVLLNFYERVGLAVELGVADEEILKDFFKGIFNRQFYIMKEYIEDVRKDRHDNQIFIQFEKAALKWNS